MRWNIKPKPDWRWKFAFLPLNIGTQFVWLEWVQWNHVTEDEGNWAGGGCGITTYRDANGKEIGSKRVFYSL